ncbi:putative F-box/kelch-repeat protein At1g12870 [Rhododendron vialii]|uniref:putative F-box/kelch-repeat protein At1g12870 n=1 Tax=Rhododendron vialii TaxID=182163 RepID=UPI00265DAF7D|nr:putative F-box/kelch-repeat protein At1g12870 [Rhododendron vialii]
MAMDEEMPEDALTEILSRLPVKSLLRFKSISKHWYSLIQSPCFISLHHNRSPKNESLLVLRSVKTTSAFAPITLALSVVSNKTPVLDLDLPFGGQPASWLNLFGSSNGIVCLFNSSTKIMMLCNPAMREFKVLPQPPFHTRYTSHLRFAFDPKTNDYKVLRVVASYDPMAFTFTLCVGRVQIYHMSTDTWREIVAVVPEEILQCSQRWCWSSASLNGVFYWVANCQGEIIAFHMSDELFERVFLPEDIRTNPWSSLSILGDSLALVTVEFGRMESCLEIWVRDGNGVKDPWNKKYSIGPIVGLYDALGFRHTGEVLLRRDNDWKMVSYNLDSHTLNEYHEEYDDLKLVHRCPVLSYTASLVSVKRPV